MSEKQFEPGAEGFKAIQAVKRRVEIEDDDDIAFLGAYPKKIKQVEVVVNVDVGNEIDFKEGNENNTFVVSNFIKNEKEDLDVSVRNNSIVKASTEVGIQNCENNVRDGYIEDISHLTNAQQEHNGDIINDSVNNMEGVESQICCKGVNEDDTSAVNNFVVKKEIDDDDDIVFLGVYPKKIKQEEAVLNAEVENEIRFKESNANNTVIVNNCIIKSENEDIDVTVQNNTVVNISSEVIIQNCESNAREGNFDISHLTNTRLEHDGDIINDSVNKIEGLENLISYKEANEDTAVVNNFVVKIENNDVDVSTVDYIRQECAIENNVDIDNQSGEGIFEKDGDNDKQIEVDIVLKKEKDVDESIANNRTDNILKNCDSNVKSDVTLCVDSIRLTIKQEKDADDTSINLEAANLNFDCPSVPIKKENTNDVQCSVGPSLVTDNSTELTSMMDLNESLHSNESLANAIFSSDSRKQFDFHCLSKKSDELEVATDDEELCDTAPSSPVSEDDGITPEDLAVMNLTQIEANAGLFESSVLRNTGELTMNKHCAFYGLSPLDFNTKIESTDLSNCSLILTAIRKRLEDFKIDSSRNDVNFVEDVKNILSVSKGDGADENLNARPKRTSKSPTLESDQKGSEKSLGRHSPVYTCPRQEPIVFETPETGGFDLNAVRCLKNWQNDEIRKLIYPKIRNGIPRTAESDLRNNMQVGNVSLRTLASERFPSSAGSSITTNGNSLQKKRSYPGSDILEPVISSPEAVPVSATLVCRKKTLSNNAESPKKIQKIVVAAPEISGDVIAHSCLVNDPLNPSRISSLEEESMFAEPSLPVKDLREYLNRKKNGH